MANCHKVLADPPFGSSSECAACYAQAEANFKNACANCTDQPCVDALYAIYLDTISHCPCGAFHPTARERIQAMVAESHAALVQHIRDRRYVLRQGAVPHSEQDDGA